MLILKITAEILYLHVPLYLHIQPEQSTADGAA